MSEQPKNLILVLACWLMSVQADENYVNERPKTPEPDIAIYS